MKTHTHSLNVTSPILGKDREETSLLARAGLSSREHEALTVPGPPENIHKHYKIKAP